MHTEICVSVACHVHRAICTFVYKYMRVYTSEGPRVEIVPPSSLVFIIDAFRFVFVVDNNTLPSSPDVSGTPLPEPELVPVPTR